MGEIEPQVISNEFPETTTVASYEGKELFPPAVASIIDNISFDFYNIYKTFDWSNAEVGEEFLGNSFSSFLGWLDVQTSHEFSFQDDVEHSRTFSNFYEALLRIEN